MLQETGVRTQQEKYRSLHQGPIIEFIRNEHAAMSFGIVRHNNRYQWKDSTLEFSSIHIATYFGLDRILQQLLHTGHDSKAVDRFGWTALHHAALEVRTDCLRVLWGAEQDYESQSMQVWIALHISAIEAIPSL